MKHTISAVAGALISLSAAASSDCLSITGSAGSDFNSIASLAVGDEVTFGDRVSYVSKAETRTSWIPFLSGTRLEPELDQVQIGWSVGRIGPTIYRLHHTSIDEVVDVTTEDETFQLPEIRTIEVIVASLPASAAVRDHNISIEPSDQCAASGSL